MSIVFSSTPTGANGTALGSIVPSVGNNFTSNGAAYATAEIQSSELYLVPVNSFDVGYVICNPVSALGNIQKITTTWRFGSSAADSYHGLVINFADSANMYSVETNQYAGPGLSVKRITGGGITYIGGYTWTPSNNTSYSVSFSNDGTGNLEIKLDGVSVITIDDTANNRTGGNAGMRSEQFGTSVPQLFFSNIVVENSIGGGGTNHGFFIQ